MQLLFLLICAPLFLGQTLWGGTVFLHVYAWVGAQPSAATCTQAYCEAGRCVMCSWPRFSTLCCPLSPLHSAHSSPLTGTAMHMFDVDRSPFIFLVTLQFIACFTQSYLVEEKNRKQGATELCNATAFITVSKISLKRDTTCWQNASTNITPRATSRLVCTLSHTVPFNILCV